jgi:hypothetical protein
MEPGQPLSTVLEKALSGRADDVGHLAGGRGILRGAGARGEHRQSIERAGGCAQMPLRHVEINGGLLQITVAEENLDSAQVGAGLQQVGRE